MKVILKRFLVGVMALWALVVILALVAGAGLLLWHLGGLRAWAQWKAERIAAGDRLAWCQLVGPELPDADNFAKAPLVAAAFREEEGPANPLLALQLPKGAEKALGSWREGRPDDLEALAKACGARDMATVLGPYAGGLARLESASRRRACRSGVDYAEGGMPRLEGFRGAVRLLRVRAVLRLRQGDPEGALQDVRTCLRVGQRVGSEPCLLAGLLQQAVVGIALQPIWEGLRGHRWTPAQLEAIRQELAGLDLLAGWRLALEGERLKLLEGLSRTADGRSAKDVPGVPALRAPGFLGRRWLYRNLLVQDRQMVRNQLEILEVPAHRVHPERHEPSEAWARRLRWRKDLGLAALALPALDDQLQRVAANQAQVDMAGVACALERYRLAKGAHPAGLEALGPGLPCDVATGQALRYRRTQRGFRLYSLGWNGKDDRGIAAWRVEQGKRRQDLELGDWVWPE